MLLPQQPSLAKPVPCTYCYNVLTPCTKSLPHPYPTHPHCISAPSHACYPKPHSRQWARAECTHCHAKNTSVTFLRYSHDWMQRLDGTPLPPLSASPSPEHNTRPSPLLSPPLHKLSRPFHSHFKIYYYNSLEAIHNFCFNCFNMKHQRPQNQNVLFTCLANLLPSPSSN